MAYINLLEIVYPIGSVYISTTNISPSEIVGGTWEKINENATLLNNSNVGGYSGSLKIQTNQLPKHAHSLFETIDNEYINKENAESINTKIFFNSNSTTYCYLHTGMVQTTVRPELDIRQNGWGQDYFPYGYCVNIWHRTA